MKEQKKSILKEKEQKSKKTMNYNDRLDGYGFGEADSEEESDPTKEEDEDSEGDKKYGPIDQYSFRSPPFGKQHQSEEKTERDVNQDP